MPQIITADVTSDSYTLQTTQADDFIFVAAGVLVSNSNSGQYPAYSTVGVFHENNRIGVAGTLMSGGGATIYSLYANNTVTVTSTGTILSLATIWDAVDFRASGAQVFNDGEITGMRSAIVSQFRDTTVFNTGLISGVTAGVDGATRVENLGTIRGATAVSMSGGNDTLINSGALIGNVDLGDGADIFDGRGGTVTGTIAGGSGDDRFRVSTADVDIIELDLGGFDTVLSSVDFALGDWIEALTLTGAAVRGSGSASGNTITGNAIDNILNGGAGDDALNGGTGADTLRGGVGLDLLSGGDDDDVLSGGSDNDALLGEVGRDRLEGGSGLDTLNGGAGDDTLLGETGNDSLVGGVDDDLLYGGRGRDTLAGGADFDTFALVKLSDSGTTVATRDVISDFLSGADVIDLSRLDAKTGGNDDAFAFIGAAAFSSVAGQLRFRVSGANVIVEGDVTGDGVADFAIVLGATVAVIATDFVL